MRALSNITVIAQATFREAVRGKQLLATAILAASLMLVMSLFGLVTIGDQARVLKDFGLFATSFASVGYACITGASFLEKELTRRTIYNILGKPVSRWHFMIGKYVGMTLTGSCLSGILMAVVIAIGCVVEGHIDLGLFKALLFILFELSIMCAAVLFFSSIVVTPVLSGVFTFGLFLAGRSADYFLYFVENGSMQGFGAAVLKGLYWLLPNFAQLNVANLVTFGETISTARCLAGFAYAASYSCLLLWASCILFARRDFN